MLKMRPTSSVLPQSSIKFSRRFLTPILFFVLLGNRCCSLAPTAIILDTPELRWGQRLEGADLSEAEFQVQLKDSATTIDVIVSSLGQMTDYRYKLGPADSTDCKQADGYTDWIPSAQRLQEDFAALSDGWIRLCLLGKGIDSCTRDEIIQPFESPTSLRWEKDTTPPSDFLILTPVGSTISTLDTTISLSPAVDAVAYDVTVATSSACDTGVVTTQHLTDGAVSFPLTLPSFGTYYVCADAFDDLGLKKSASNSGGQFIAAQYQEVVDKDHVTDASCWNSTNAAFNNFNGPGENDAIAAAAFDAKGGILKRVGGVFVTSDCSIFNSGKLENMTATVAFYENKDAFLADPYLKNQPEGSVNRRVAAQILHTDSNDPKYYLNPVNVTAQGTKQYYVEVDVSSANIQTSQDKEQLVALWLSSDSTTDGVAWSVFSNGCPGQIGNNVDYYKSDNDHQPRPAAKLSEINGAAQSFGAFFVSELK